MGQTWVVGWPTLALAVATIGVAVTFVTAKEYLYARISSGASALLFGMSGYGFAKALLAPTTAAVIVGLAVGLTVGTAMWRFIDRKAHAPPGTLELVQTPWPYAGNAFFSIGATIRNNAERMAYNNDWELFVTSADNAVSETMRPSQCGSETVRLQHGLDPYEMWQSYGFQFAYTRRFPKIESFKGASFRLSVTDRHGDKLLAYVPEPKHDT